MEPVVRLATCARLPEPDPDEKLLVAALAARGIAARMAAWDDPTEPWDAPVPTVIRSTWNYIHRHAEFLGWAERTARAAPMWNSLDVVRWSAHKSYLLDLAARGHAVVPTRYVARGERAALGDIADVVIKPTVGAGSFATRRFRAGDEAAAQAHLDRLVEEREVMVQEYIPSVEGYGERALVWIDGALTHAVRKAPRFLGDAETVGAAVPIADDERALAEAVLEPLAGRLLYGRVDVARGRDGRPMVMELELVEPSLFLLQSRAALDRLADGIARVVGAG
jgi:glutathione synthase/RimK-type ligase-like ATP-grasp enzyme